MINVVIVRPAEWPAAPRRVRRGAPRRDVHARHRHRRPL